MHTAYKIRRKKKQSQTKTTGIDNINEDIIITWTDTEGSNGLRK